MNVSPFLRLNFKFLWQGGDYLKICGWGAQKP